jgi:hypothetical protein
MNICNYMIVTFFMVIPVAERCKARRICGQSLAGIAGSNPTRDVDICLLRALYVVRHKSLRRADHSSRGVLPSVVCHCV